MGKWLVCVAVVIGCKSSPHQQPPPAPPPAPPADATAEPVDAAEPIDAAPIADAATPDAPPAPAPKPKPSSKLTYISDCSLTHPIARNVCSGTEPQTNGLKSCTDLKVKPGDKCSAGAPRCWVPRTCDDGRVLPSDFLECTEKQSDRCMMRSSRQFKRDIEYLDADQLADLAAQVEALRVARYRYKDSYESHLGFIIEDAPDAAFVTRDGKHVDLYGLLAASIATLHAQDARIKALEAKCPGEKQ